MFTQHDYLQTYRDTISDYVHSFSLTCNLLGASTALLGKEGAMACTVAVEDVIGDHYNSQIRELMEDDPEAHKELLKVCSFLLGRSLMIG